MNTEEFVGALCRYSLPEGAASVFSTLKTECKRETQIQRRLRSWYEAQEPESREIAELLVQFSVASMLFGLLVVLDNCDAIENGPDKGEFSIFYTKDGTSTKLGGFPDLLHDNLPELDDLVNAANPDNLRKIQDGDK